MRPLSLLPFFLVLTAFAPRPSEIPPPFATDATAAASVVGSWAFTMDRPGGGDPLSGTMVIAADGGGRIEVPSLHLNSNVDNGRLEHDGEAFTWSGRTGSPLGSLDFTIHGEVAGDRMRAQSELAGLGTVNLTATRQAEG